MTRTRNSRTDPPRLLISGVSSIIDVPGLEAACPDLEIVVASDENALDNALPGTEILLGWNFRGRELEDHWHRADSLRWIHWCGAGVDALLFPALAESDVQVTNSRGIFDRAMAETVLGYLLAEAKRFRESWDLQKNREWRYRRSDLLENQRALVVGVGSIGHEVGRLLGAAGLRVQGVGRSSRENDPVFGQVHAQKELLSLVGEAEWVISVLPSTPETRGIFDREFFQAMRPEARFINIGRGDAQDENALLEALQKGTIAGAMLDVFCSEPLPVDSPLWDAENLFVSPHISGDYHNYPEDVVRLFLGNLDRYRNHRPLLNQIDKVRGYAKQG